MPILFVNNRIPLFDASCNGGANRTNLFIKALCRIDTVDIASFRGKEVSTDPMCNIVYDNYIPTVPRPYDSWRRCQKLVGLFSCDISDIYSCSEAKAKVISSIVKRKQYTFIACRYLDDAVECGLLQYLDRLILDIDDNPINQYKLWRKEFVSQRTTALNNLFWWLFTWRFARENNRIIKKTPIVFYSSPIGKQTRNSVFLHNLSMIRPNNAPRTEILPKRVLMVGDYQYTMNDSGIRHFVSSVWPLILKEVGNAEFMVVGAHISDDLHEFLNGYENVTVRGYVRSLEDEYANSRVVVVPNYFGTGTSIKTIEAIMSGVPIVSTSSGVRGYSRKLVNGRDYLLADSDKDFAEAVIKLLLDVNYSNVIASNAYRIYEANWSKQLFLEIVSSTVKNRLNHD